MSEFLSIDPTERSYLWYLSFRRKTVFGSPNDVLKSVLLIDSKHSDDTKKEKKIKIRIDDEVLEKLKSKARQLNMPVQPLDKLVEKILEHEDKENDVPLVRRPRPAIRPGERARRACGRPATR